MWPRQWRSRRRSPCRVERQRSSSSALNEQLAIDASMMDIMWRDEMPLQMQWLRQPASLLRLLQRPVWLDAWLRGEEERASLLWRGLPNHVMTQAWTQGALASMYNDVCLCVFNVPLRAD